MKKTLVILIITLFVIAGLGLGISRLTGVNNTQSPTAVPTTAVTLPPTLPVNPTETLPVSTDIKDYKTITIEIDGKAVNLVEGSAEIPAAPDSIETITYTYFGNEAYGDLDGDGTEDVTFLLTQSGAGSGVFYYVVAASQTNNGYEGTNAILLGDRIAPQSTMIEDEMVVVNYADRLPTEPFTTQPSVGVTKYLKIKEGFLMEVNVLSQITDRTWTWVKTEMNDGTLTLPQNPDLFTITFQKDGSMNGTTDCNNFMGQYTLMDNKLTLASIGTTRMACENSQEGDFLKALGEVDQFLINPLENSLVLLIKFDSGAIIFK